MKNYRLNIIFTIWTLRKGRYRTKLNIFHCLRSVRPRCIRGIKRKTNVTIRKKSVVVNIIPGVWQLFTFFSGTKMVMARLGFEHRRFYLQGEHSNKLHHRRGLNVHGCVSAPRNTLESTCFRNIMIRETNNGIFSEYKNVHVWFSS